MDEDPYRMWVFRLENGELQSNSSDVWIWTTYQVGVHWYYWTSFDTSASYRILLLLPIHLHDDHSQVSELLEQLLPMCRMDLKPDSSFIIDMRSQSQQFLRQIKLLSDLSALRAFVSSLVFQRYQGLTVLEMSVPALESESWRCLYWGLCELCCFHKLNSMTWIVMRWYIRSLFLRKSLILSFWFPSSQKVNPRLHNLGLSQCDQALSGLALLTLRLNYSRLFSAAQFQTSNCSDASQYFEGCKIPKQSLLRIASSLFESLCP